ncbi:MAG TPA: NAD(P)H-dependent oxidoreductase subunit E, partial [Bryobacteraceae bacterium]|nr:NAD(P)H-dependent oxidoreductase subunit E [Bryobacteraceae bacterium]
MDLHLTGDQATVDERAAIDRELGEPQCGWEGGERRIEFDGRVAVGGGHFRSRRDRLLPALHAVQRRIGWISPGAVNYIAQRLDVPPAEIHGVASFYHMFSLEPRAPVVAYVCEDIACLARGAGRLCEELEENPSPGVEVRRAPCLGLCERAPAALITAAGDHAWERVVAPVTREALASALVPPAVNGSAPAEPDKLQTGLSVPQAGQPQLRLLRRVGHTDPADIHDYRRLGGYDALRLAVELGPERVISELVDSRLLGRGGAAFPTGRKSDAVRLYPDPARPRYLVCNADESEPGTFKDRIIMEGDPFAVLEGMSILAYAAGVRKGYIYIRGEYPLAAQRLQHGIETARAHGLLGKGICGADFHFDIELRRGAGAYICGEETALFNSIEGYRGEPRNKPPFPAQSGLFHQPTVVNNVETIVNVPEILLGGGAAYARIGTAQS